MSIVDDRNSVAAEEEELDLSAPEHRAAGRWNSEGVPGERSKDFRRSLGRLFVMLGRSRITLVIVVLLAVIGATCNVFGPKILGHATDIIVSGSFGGHGIDFAALHRVLFEALAVYGASAALSIVSSYMLAGVIQRLMSRLRDE